MNINDNNDNRKKYYSNTNDIGFGEFHFYSDKKSAYDRPHSRKEIHINNKTKGYTFFLIIAIMIIGFIMVLYNMFF